MFYRPLNVCLSRMIGHYIVNVFHYLAFILTDALLPLLTLSTGTATPPFLTFADTNNIQGPCTLWEPGSSTNGLYIYIKYILVSFIGIGQIGFLLRSLWFVLAGHMYLHKLIVNMYMCTADFHQINGALSMEYNKPNTILSIFMFNEH